MGRAWHAAPCALLLASWPGAAFAADDDQSFGTLSQEVISTSAPGFALLGVSGETISTPEQLKTFGIALIDGLNDDGDTEKGLGIQFSLVELLAPESASFKNYSDSKKGYWTRAKARFLINAALAQAQGDEHPDAMRSAIGFTWVPFDTTDPFANKALNSCMSLFKRTRPIPDLSDEGGYKDSELQAWYKDCREKNTRTPSDGITSQIGFAKTFFSDSGKTSDFKSSGFGVNGVLSIGLNGFFKGYTKNAQGVDTHKSGSLDSRLILGALYREKEYVANPDDDTQFINRNRFSFGGRILLGNDKKFIFGMELLRNRASYTTGTVDNYTSYTATSDIKIAKNLWITISYSDTSGKKLATENSAKVNGGLRWALAPSASLAGTQ